MEATFYIFRKRSNSTAIPSDSTTSQTYDIQLKEPCSILNPVIILSGRRISYNYCYIPAFTRYYFITEQTFLTGNRTQLTLSCDELASWRQGIQNYTAFIERCSNAAVYNTMTDDNLLSSRVTINKSSISSTALTGFDSTGFYMMRTVGAGASGSGITSYYLTAAELASVMSYMFTSDNFSDVITTEPVKAFFNPFQYIVDLKWVPVAMTDTLIAATTLDTVKFGWWDSGVSARKYALTGTSPGWNFTAASINIPSNPYNDFRKYSNRFSYYSIFLPGAGSFDLDAGQLAEGLCCKYTIDFTTGNGLIMLYTGSLDSSNNPSGVLLSSYSCRMCTSIQIGQLESQAKSVISGVAGVVGSVLSGNIGNAVSTAIDTATGALSPQASVNGYEGDRFNLIANHNILVSLDALDSCAFATQWAGRPAFITASLGQVLQNFGGGYVKCGGASVPLAGFQPEIDAVNNALNTGFYLE